MWGGLNWVKTDSQHLHVLLPESVNYSVFENCALLGYYATSSGNSLSTFRDNLPVPSSQCMNPNKFLNPEDRTAMLSLHVGKKLNCVWNVMAHGDAREGKWRGNWRMEWVASPRHTTSEHGLSNITIAYARTSAACSWLNWRPCRFNPLNAELNPICQLLALLGGATIVVVSRLRVKWSLPFLRKMKSGFCACAITFQTNSTTTQCIATQKSPVLSCFAAEAWYHAYYTSYFFKVSGHVNNIFVLFIKKYLFRDCGFPVGEIKRHKQPDFCS